MNTDIAVPIKVINIPITKNSQRRGIFLIKENVVYWKKTNQPITNKIIEILLVEIKLGP
jgi:hypothetical protein